MAKITLPNVLTHYIAFNAGLTNFHYGYTDINNVTETGLDILETFSDQNDFINRLNELNIVLELDENNAPIYSGSYYV